ncbi:MAG: hypothetical protein AB1700_13185, partial [Bacillota bacterium]
MSGRPATEADLHVHVAPDVAVSVSDLHKSYFIPIRRPGLWGSLRQLVSRETREVRAVDGISFDIPRGQL